METKATIYIPQVFRSFQGFYLKDIQEWRERRHMELILEAEPGKEYFCCRCGTKMGNQRGRYKLRCKHMRIMDWTTEVIFWRETRDCPNCKKERSEHIEFICPQSPHVTKDLSWWINRLTEITSVLSVSKLVSIDKMTCYKVDKYILRRLLQGYKIPKMSRISVDEVYARGPRQLKAGETRDDLFLTVVVDIKTHKVIWVSKSRRKEALDEFFQLIGPRWCQDITVVATDQHPGYTASVEEYCPKAKVVLDKFHLIQNFNEALNEDRKSEYERVGENYMELNENLLKGKYRYLYLTKASKRTPEQRKHIEEITSMNKKISQMEMIKEHFHKMFNCTSITEAKIMMADVYQWAFDCGAQHVWNWIKQIREDQRFWNYFLYRVSTSISEGINRVIKGLKWQAYGYKDMQYFALKILQKCGYLNSQYYLVTGK